MKACCPPGEGCNAPAGREEPCLLWRCRRLDSPSADRAVALWATFVSAERERRPGRQRTLPRPLPGSADPRPTPNWPTGPITMTTITDLDDFKALDPFFRIIEKGLDGVADGGHFFDLLAEKVIFDYIITTPGYPRRVEGRKAVAELYRPYGTMIVLDRCHDLAVHHDIKTGVVVLEYASEGRVVSTGAPYTNRYISVLTITDRKVTHWRDYLDPVAVFDALGWPSR